MDSFSRILEKKLSELLCTRLYLKGISLRLASPHCAAAAPSGASCIHRESVHRPFCVVPCSPAVQNDLHRPPLTDARPERLNQQATRHDRVGWPSLHTYIYAHASHNRRRPLGTTRAGWPCGSRMASTAWWCGRPTYPPCRYEDTRKCACTRR